MRTKILVLLVVLLLVALSSWAFFHTQFFRVHDYVHGARITEMSQALLDGHVPPRWSSNFGYGYGMPLFEFYAPLPFFIGALIFLAGVPLIVAVKLLFLIPTVAVGFGGYLLGRQLFGRWGGVLTAAGLLLAPYRAVDMFVRGAVSELWGMMTFPWIILGMLFIFQKKRRGVTMLIVSLTVLFLSHNLSLVMFVPFSLLFAVGMLMYHYKAGQSWQDLWPASVRILWSYTCAGLISAFYLVPAFLEKDATVVKEAIVSGYFEYELHFVGLRQFLVPNWGYGGSTYGPYDDMSFFLGWGQLVALGTGIVFVAAWLVKKWKRSPKVATFFGKLRLLLWKKEVFISCMLSLLFAASLFLANQRSQLLWEAVPLLQYLQFPWRWLGVASFWLALLVGAVGTILFPRRQVLVGLVLLLTLGLNVLYFRPNGFLSDNTEFYYENPERIQTEMSEVLSDYLSQTFSLPDRDLRALVTDEHGTALPVKFLRQKTQQLVFLVELDSATTVFAPIADFPGWRVVVDGTQQSLLRNEFGLVGVALAPGVHTVEFHFGATPVRSASDSISLLGITAFLITFLWMHRPQSREATR